MAGVVGTDAIRQIVRRIERWAETDNDRKKVAKFRYYRPEPVTELGETFKGTEPVAFITVKELASGKYIIEELDLVVVVKENETITRQA